MSFHKSLKMTYYGKVVYCGIFFVVLIVLSICQNLKKLNLGLHLLMKKTKRENFTFLSVSRENSGYIFFKIPVVKCGICDLVSVKTLIST